MALNFDKQNERVIEWSNRTATALKGEGNALGIQHISRSPNKTSSLGKIKDRQRYRDGIITSIGFSFPRTLIYPHKGAGKGIGGDKGSRWTDKYGISRETNPASLGKIGTGSRVEKPWFNQVMEGATGVDELATIVAEETGDAIVNNILIR